MSTPINDGGPAFPVPGLQNDADFNGMTLRDYFAAKALPCANDAMHGMTHADYFAGRAYELADAMLKARSAGHVDEATRQLHHAVNAALDALTDERADGAYKAEVASLLRTAIANTTGSAAALEQWTLQRVLKYPLPIGEWAGITMPEGAEPLTVQVQHGTPTLWARVDVSKPPVVHHFRIAGTGHDLGGNVGRYVGTVQIDGGQLVLHVFAEAGAYSMGGAA